MIQLQQNRYLWVHFFALAWVPLLLDFCLWGLASARAAFGYPSAYGLQFWLVVLLCVGLPLWMQVARPFYIFSLPPLALRPSRLTREQKRELTVLTSWQIKALAGVVAVFSVWLLAQLYEKATVVRSTIPLGSAGAGFITAVVTFFLACLFMQIGVSAARSLLVSPSALKRVAPYEGDVAKSFLIAGLRVDKLPLDSAISVPSAADIPNARPVAPSASPEDSVVEAENGGE